MSLLNDHTFLTVATASLPLYSVVASAVLTGTVGKVLLRVDFGKSFLLTIVVLVAFYLAQMMILFLMRT